MAPRFPINDADFRTGTLAVAPICRGRDPGYTFVMPFALNFYRDQIGAEGSSSSPLRPAHRVLYVRHGRVTVNDRIMSADEAAYCDEPLALKSTGEWSEIWRWELALPNAPPILHDGAGLLSQLRMSRVITSLAMLEGTRWLFRLDRIVSAAGRIADRHQHPGPGIRCLLEGTFNVQQTIESVRDLSPGDAWWETGSDTVIAWGSQQMAAKFLRGMVLPAEWEGRVTGTWLSGHLPPPGNWKLYVDHIIAV
jgi:hypothetical protein